MRRIFSTRFAVHKKRHSLMKDSEWRLWRGFVENDHRRGKKRCTHIIHKALEVRLQEGCRRSSLANAPHMILQPVIVRGKTYLVSMRENAQMLRWPLNGCINIFSSVRLAI